MGFISTLCRVSYKQFLMKKVSGVPFIWTSDIRLTDLFLSFSSQTDALIVKSQFPLEGQ